ncbi:MAG: hypothetical protein QNJ19_05135 [Woeseiaceae bacterium]|nr:hypothetical protein [Woeseiaceae bacterium]
MPESKNLGWLGNYPEQAEEPAEAMTPDQPAANDADGWQQYRHWISKAPAPSSRRVGIDPSLYTWRSYRSWTEDVKRNWPDKDDD